LFYECYPKVRRVVSRQLNSRLRRYIDSTDIANDVLGDLAIKAERFCFDSVDDVRSFLIDAAHKRVIDEDRRTRTRKRDVNRERPMPDVAVGDDPWQISSGEPTPSQVAVANETDEAIRSAPDDDAGRLIVTRRFENYDIKEISSETGLSVRSIQRFLEKLRKTIVN
jgi:RNA polymerase sigma factor (sigma-70 family)